MVEYFFFLIITKIKIFNFIKIDLCLGPMKDKVGIYSYKALKILIIKKEMLNG